MYYFQIDIKKSRYHNEYAIAAYVHSKQRTTKRSERLNMDVDYYKLLNLSHLATTSEIKARYKYLAKKNHPDREGDTTQMSKINKAYAVLSNPKTRYEYNRALAIKKQSSTLESAAAPAEPTVKSADLSATDSSHSLKLTFRPFHSVGLLAFLIIGLAIIGLLGFFHQHSNASLNPAGSSSMSGTTESISGAPDRKAIGSNSVAGSSTSKTVNRVSTFGSTLLDQALHAFNHGKTTVRACEKERQDINQEMAALQLEMHTSQNQLASLSANMRNIQLKTIGAMPQEYTNQYDQLSTQVTQYQTELDSLQKSFTIC